MSWTEDEDQIDFFVNLFESGTRMRFSTAERIARLEIFCKGDRNRTLEDRLKRAGWRLSCVREDLPGISGVIYQHNSVTRQRVRRTREVISMFVSGPRFKTEEWDGVWGDIQGEVRLTKRQASKAARQFRVGKYIADYEPLTAEEMCKTDPEMDELLANSRRADGE